MSGNQDICFYNFLCAHRFMEISDFNHLYSNISYLLLGAFFLVLARCKEKNSNLKSERGIPHHFGLYYAMGGALFMEGVLSACYHVCPSYSNIQFDTTFMYIIAMLCMLKIYQSRHPDINASATFAYLIFAAVPSLAVYGVLGPSIWFYVVFDILHLLTCGCLSLQIFYMGHWKLAFKGPRGTFADFLRRSIFRERLFLLILGNGVNICLAGWLLWSQTKDFSGHILLIFITNLMLYTVYYIIMKIRSKETIIWQPIVYGVLSTGCWIVAGLHYFDNTISWLETPAQSRAHNTPCKILRYYDNHDVWHMFSAAGLFFWYMVLLTLDDDLQDKERTEIKVF